MATTSNMFLYSLSLAPPSHITHALVGQFAGTKEQFIATAAGPQLTLLRPDPQSGSVRPLLSHNVFGIIRGLAAFRLAGSSKDYLIISSDSGKITIVEYNPSRNCLVRVHLETFGKSGVRRVVPGDFLACDPKGRACLIASIEKNKLVYVLNRNAEAQLTISSPLEAHKPYVHVLSMTALDVGYSNPVFAALETDYSELDQDPTGQALHDVQTLLVYYELDLGLNHVVRKWSEPVDPSSFLLFQVPGGNDGPSGVLVCGEENITYRHSNQDPLRVPIPRRQGAMEDPSRKRNVACGVMHKLKGSTGAFFFLLQTEDGDLFKVTMDMVEDEDGRPTGEVQRLRIKYFDTVPLATSLCILKSGFLFVACQSGNHLFYQFEKLGDDDAEDEFSSETFSADPSAAYDPVYFRPRPAENLALMESVDALHPLLDCQVANLTDEDAPQLYAVCGSGARSTFRTIQHGTEVHEIVASDLPGTPSAVWTLKLNRADAYDSYILLSFANASLVLSIGETVVEVRDSGFLTHVSTLGAQLLGERGLVQIHAKGIRHLVVDGEINDWPTPANSTIVACATNEHQVVIALSSNELVYFELDTDGLLAEYEERREMSDTVLSLSLGEVAEGRRRSSFLAVGCEDCTVRVLSLDPSSIFAGRSIQALTAPPTALQIMTMDDSLSGATALYLHIGLRSGVYLRAVLDELSGELADTRQRFLGPRRVRLFPVTVQGRRCVLALSSRAWLGYTDPATRTFNLTPLRYVDLAYASSFASEQCDEGLVGIQGQSLRIFSVARLGQSVIQKSIPLTYTPRQLLRHPEAPIFYTIEADNNTLAPELRQQLLSASDQPEEAPLPPQDFGYPKGRGRWASCISVVDPLGTTKDKNQTNGAADDDDEEEEEEEEVQGRVLQTVDMTNNESATAMAIVPFASQDHESFLVVGTAKDLVLNPRTFTEGYLHVYRFQDAGRRLQYIHSTKVEEPPTTMHAFQGRLLVGMGRMLRIYDLGMKQMLRKTQAEVVSTNIVSLNIQGNRVVVGDTMQGMTYVVYKPQVNKLMPFADDTMHRWTTCSTMVDYDSVAGGDKFGNLWILRCPEAASKEADEDPKGVRLAHARSYLHGASARLDLMAHFYPQDAPTSIGKTNLVVGGPDVLLWTGLMGTVGVLVPFVHREDVNFFQALEAAMRVEDGGPLAGRDHLMYRGYYVPVKGVIDGDLCERYTLLANDRKQAVAADLDRSVREVERKIADLRSRSAF